MTDRADRTLAEWAGRLDVAVNTLRAWTRKENGRLRSHSVDGTIFIALDDLETFYAQHRGLPAVRKSASVLASIRLDLKQGDAEPTRDAPPSAGKPEDGSRVRAGEVPSLHEALRDLRMATLAAIDLAAIAAKSAEALATSQKEAVEQIRLIVQSVDNAFAQIQPLEPPEAAPSSNA